MKKKAEHLPDEDETVDHRSQSERRDEPPRKRRVVEPVPSIAPTVEDLQN